MKQPGGVVLVGVCCLGEERVAGANYLRAEAFWVKTADLWFPSLGNVGGGATLLKLPLREGRTKGDLKLQISHSV